MGTKIEWADETWNPIKMRCTPVSEGCQNCYAQRLLSRNLPGFKGYPKNGEGPHLEAGELEKIIRWKKPRRIFVESMGDLFHDDLFHMDNYFMLSRMYSMFLYHKHHTFMLLTKRPHRMKQWADNIVFQGGRVPSNVWLGVTAENQPTADERIPILLQIPAAVHFVSVEPMLGPVDLNKRECIIDKTRFQYTIGRYLDWVICGAETGPKARPINVGWVEDLLEGCRVANVPFFFKKWGPHPVHYPEIDIDHEGLLPEDEMPREFPIAQRSLSCQI